MDKNRRFTLATPEELSAYIGIGVRTINERWIPNEKKIRQYNGLQVITYLDKEGISEDLLVFLVENYKSIVENSDIRKKIVFEVLDKGLDDE